jgi:predicted membrane GTPase involved in stress response
LVTHAHTQTSTCTRTHTHPCAQVIGIHQRAGDLKVNPCKKKALTNMRAAGKDATVVLSEPVEVNLDYALEVGGVGGGGGG